MLFSSVCRGSAGSPLCGITTGSVKLSASKVSVGRASNVWKYDTYLDIDENENIIAPPKSGEDWNAWYTEMKDYQKYLRENVNDPTKLRLQLLLNSNSIARLNFKRVLNFCPMNLKEATKKIRQK